MSASKRWTVEIHIDEHEGRTRALARLHNRDGTGLVGLGLARLNPRIATCPRSVTSWPWLARCPTWVTSFWTPQQAISSKLPISRCI